MPREQITQEQIEKVIENFKWKLQERLREKGFGTFASSHEILGIITEEYKEMLDAVHKNNIESLKLELMDIAVGAIFGIACIDANTLDW
jgi:NTP pyrophosphatase (non-canonical NTP hydrolase)